MLVVAACLFALGVLGLVFGMARAAEEASKARLQAEKAEAVARYFADTILRADPYDESDPAMRRIISNLDGDIGLIVG